MGVFEASGHILAQRGGFYVLQVDRTRKKWLREVLTISVGKRDSWGPMMGGSRSVILM